MNGPVAIGYTDLAIAGLLLALDAGLSIALGLRLERKLAVAATRTVVQLLLLGYLLVPIFEVGHPLLVLGMAALMLSLAAREAVGRADRRYGGAALHTFVALLAGAGLTLGATKLWVLHTEPWWDPRYLIPLLGMILGNALTGVSLGLDRCLTELDEGRDRVESRLALGASRWEAARPVAVEALRAGLIPILNSMSVVGLVTIPGMMTGQLLAGTEPALAARYQILIMFLVAAATATGAGLAVWLGLARLLDEGHRLRTDRLTRR